MVKMKRCMAMLLCIVMCISIFPAEVFADSVDETVDLGETVCLDYEHDDGENAFIAWADEGTVSEENNKSFEQRSAAVVATCSHAYTYTYAAAGHTQHTKRGTCTKCDATTSTKENHTWSGNRCTLCGCYKPITSNGTYDVIASGGVQLYSQSNSGSSKVKVVSKGSNITVTNVAATSSGYYWGKVTKVGAATQSSTAWVCMKSSELGPHTHSFAKTYAEKSDSRHEVVSTCSCGYKESATEAHSFSGGKCSLCGNVKVSNAAGGYVTYRESEPLRADVYSASASPLSVPKGTYIEISEIKTNSYGNYWGKVSSIDGKAPASTMYAYMGNLKAHTHTIVTQCANVNNVEHDATETCSGCNYTKKTRTDHSFSGGKCTACGGWQAYSAAGNYVVINADGTKLYSERISSGTSQELKTLKKGTFVRVTDVKLNSAKNYWGKVESIGNETPGQAMYIYMGSGQVQPHTHSWSTTYTTQRDTWHTEQTSCAECAYVEKTENKAHSFVNGACKYCGHAQVPSTPGSYVTYRDSEPLREAPNQEAKALDKAEKGDYLEITDIQPNEYGNYWGKVTAVGNRKLEKPLYVYMGNITPHSHSLSVNYVSSNNVSHKKTSNCPCGFTDTVREDHVFTDGKCHLCGALAPYTADGTYLVIHEDGVWTYTQRITSGSSSQVELLHKNCFIEVSDVERNSADYYWGKVIRVDGKPVTKDMYVYMGRAQLMPHAHSMDITYNSKSDTQHDKNERCPVCGFTQTEPAVEDHVFNSEGNCKHCGKEKVSNTPGLYITFRTLETLRLDPYEAADKAEKLPAGTCIEIETVITNKYGNYWGVVKSIDGAKPAKSPAYAYMGNLNAHTHSWGKTYKSVNNVSHDMTQACSTCNMSSTERQTHNYSNGACAECTAWQAYETDGDYITVKDAVPVYSQNITSPEDSRVLISLPKNTFVRVEDVKLNSANYYWGRVKRIGNDDISDEMYIYMGRGQLQSHGHSMDVTYSLKSDTQHNTNKTCTVCGYTDAKPSAENHVFDKKGVCKYCKMAEVAHSEGLYVTIRERETLRADRYADSSEAGSYPKGTALTVAEIQTNKYGNWWGKVVKINGEAAETTCYTYLGNLRPHTHSNTKTIESVNNMTHKIVTVCADCNTRNETRTAHTFENGVCKECQAWEAYSAGGGYVTVKEEGVPLYSKNSSGSTLLRTLPDGFYIEVKNVKTNSAGNYWGQVSRIGNYAVKQTMYVYMGRGQLQAHSAGDHSYSATYESINNLKHRADKVCTICSYTQTVEESHRFGTGAHNACVDCGAWKANAEAGGYLTVKEEVVLYSKRSSDTAKGSKSRKTLPKGSYLEIVDVETNSAGNWWGKVTAIDNDPTGKTALYVYMGSGSLTPHTHRMEHSLISASDTQHTYGDRCYDCAVFTRNSPEEHTFRNNRCTICEREEVCHETGSYVTVKETESLKADTFADSKEVNKVPAGTLLEVSKVVVNKYGNYWGKVSKISGESVGKKSVYTYMGNLERHASHTLKPFWESDNDAQHQVGEKCTQCDYMRFTSTEDHIFGSDGICVKCAKTAVSTEDGNYVTVRDAEPLRASASKDAKALKNVPAGTRLQISQVKENGYNNYWGVVSKIDGKDTGLKKTIYVYMGNVQRHENHDMQPFCDRKSDTQHTSGLRCTGCNLTKNTEQNNHRMDSNGRCPDCGAEEILHGEGGYLVRTAGNLKKGRGQDTGTVQWVAEGAYLAVTDIATNAYGNWWGKVISIDGAKPKKANTYVYLGNLTPHAHDFTVSYVPKDHNSHTITRICAQCGYRQEQDSKHADPVDGKCPTCQAEIPLSTTKGDYATFRDVMLYQDNKLTKPAGIVVEAGYLVRIASVKQVKAANGSAIYVGKLSQYGNAPVGKDVLYVKMSDITPHVTHTYTQGYWSKCDAYHYWSHACPVVGCSATQKGQEEAHVFPDGKCVCGKTPVPQENGIYRVRSGSDLELFSKDISTSASAGMAKGGSIIVVEGVRRNPNTGNYWGKVTWFNGKKATKTTYVYMGSLVPYTRAASVTVSGSDQNYHYLRDGSEIFPEKHNFRNGVCDGCGMVNNAPVTGLYIVKETCSLYSKSNSSTVRVTVKKYQSGSVLQIKSIEHIRGDWYGLVTTCDGVKVKGTYYVRLDGLTYHGQHQADSEHWTQLNDKQHTYDINCPVCGTNKKVKADHVFNDQGVCIFCAQTQPFTTKENYYIVIKQATVYKTNAENSAILETLPAGTVLKVDTVKEKNGIYMGSGLHIVENGQLTDHKGYIRMSRNWLAVHEHNWSAETLTEFTETGHRLVRTCTVCGLTDNWRVEHNAKACAVCGAKAVSIGNYTVQDQTATVYKETSGKKKYASVKEGDFVQITKIVSDNGVYWGKIFRIGEKEIKDNAYIPMRCLKTHAHNWNHVLTGAEDNYHTYKATCSSCNLTEQTLDAHSYNMGKCVVCGNAVVPESTGVYVAAENITVYKNARSGAKKVSKNATVSKGTHIYIREIKRETTLIQTEKDGSFYGEILWGRIQMAGNVKYSGEAWVRMSSLQEDYLHTQVSYTQVNDNNHHVVYECEDHGCGLKGSSTQSHQLDSTGTCGLCGFATVKKGTYYTTRSNCKIYNLPANAPTLHLMDYGGTIAKAGTPVEVLKAQPFNGEQYCYIRLETRNVWIARKDLTDHVHRGAGLYTVVDDEYHQVSGWTGSVCMICGVVIPEGDTGFAKNEHIYQDGYCKLCNMPEIHSTTGTYYAPYDGYYAYERLSQFSERGMVYNAGDVIRIEKAPIVRDGIIWGQVKDTEEYVMMKTLSKTPVKQTAEGTLLTDQEVIDWCVNFNGATPFHTYGYYTDMMGTISDADILLMAVNSRASGLSDQVVKWIEQACGETLAKKYYEGQILAMMAYLEEEAEYSVSISHKETIKNAIKLASTVADWEKTYGKELAKSEIDAIDKLKKYTKSTESLLENGELGLEILAYVTMDFGRMQGIIEAARAIQKEASDDPDLHRAFEDVIQTYEHKYYIATDQIAEVVLNLLKEMDVDKWVDEKGSKAAAAVIKKITGFDAAKGWSDWSFVYGTVNFAVDLGMDISKGAKYSESMLQFMSQISVMHASSNAYSSAVQRIQDGDHSASAVAAVRRQFAAYKASMVELYDTMLSMASNHLFGIGEDSILISYLQYEKDKLESISLVNDYNRFINGISLAEYRRTH